MRFWDSSAIVPLLVLENSSREVQSHYVENPALLVWCLTPTELLSALHRKSREGTLDGSRLAAARQRLELLRRDWVEIQNPGRVRERAERLLAVHPLKAADSLQLAAALIAIEDRPRGFGFLTLDSTLAEAAQKEGFQCQDW